MATAPRPSSLSPGTLVGGRYEVVREVGRGGVSLVFLARDVKLGTEVALKVSEVPGPLYEDFKGRFQREARLGAQLGKEQGFVRALDWGELEAERSIYLAMDYVPNAAPLDLRAGALDVRLRKLLMAARLLARVHRLGIVHRDVKPDNFLADGAGRLYLTDFGLAKELEREPAPMVEERAPSYRTGTGLTLGTPLFMSPEQFGETRDVGTRTDVYSLGVMLFHCLTGSFPYPGTNAMQVMSRQMEVRYKGAPAPTPVRSEGTDPVLGKLCMDAIHLEPARRPSAEDVARRLEAFLGPPTGTTRRPGTGPLPGQSQPTPRPTAVSPPTRAPVTQSIPTPGTSSRSQLRIDHHGLSSREVLWKVRRDIGREAFRQMIGPLLPGLRIADEKPLLGVDASGFLDRLAFLLPRQLERSVADGPGIVLGRGMDNDVILPFSTISKRQLRFDPLPNGDWTVLELGSRNGTRLNGAALASATPRVLSEGDVLCLSEHLLLEFLTPGRIVEWVEERGDSSSNAEKADGLGGRFKGDDLVEFFQMVDFHRKTGALRIHDNVRFRGTVFFLEGRLRGAHTTEGLRSDAAVRTFLALPGGRFRFTPTLPEEFVPDTDQALAPILFEALRLRDEKLRKTTQVVEIGNELLDDPDAPLRD